VITVVDGVKGGKRSEKKRTREAEEEFVCCRKVSAVR